MPHTTKYIYVAMADEHFCARDKRMGIFFLDLIQVILTTWVFNYEMVNKRTLRNNSDCYKDTCSVITEPTLRS